MTGWPYDDLPLRTPHCPLCGSVAVMMVGPGVHPMAFCEAEGCQAFAWDPTVAAFELLREQLLGDPPRAGSQLT